MSPSRERLATIVLAVAPGLVGAAIPFAGWFGLALTLTAYLTLALRVARARAGVPLTHGARGLLDVAALVAGLLAIFGTTLLATPFFPSGAAGPSRERLLGLALGALALGASVAIALPGRRAPQS